MGTSVNISGGTDDIFPDRRYHGQREKVRIPGQRNFAERIPRHHKLVQTPPPRIHEFPQKATVAGLSRQGSLHVQNRRAR